MTSGFWAWVSRRRELLLTDGEAVDRAGFGRKNSTVQCGMCELPISHLSGFVKWLIGYPSPEYQERNFRYKCRNSWCTDIFKDNMLR